MTESYATEKNGRNKISFLIGLPFVLLFGEGIGLVYGWQLGFCAGFFMGAITYPIVCAVHMWLWFRR